MNKYKKALNKIGDTLTYYMVRKDTNLLPSENEIYDAMAVLAKLVSKSNSPDQISASERLPEKSMNQPCLQKQLIIARKL